MQFVNEKNHKRLCNFSGIWVLVVVHPNPPSYIRNIKHESCSKLAQGRTVTKADYFPVQVSATYSTDYCREKIPTAYRGLLFMLRISIPEGLSVLSHCAAVRGSPIPRHYRAGQKQSDPAPRAEPPLFNFHLATSSSITFVTI